MATLSVMVDGHPFEAAPEIPMAADRPQSGFFAITPHVAESWPKANPHNRSLREGNSGAQGRDMLAEDWDVNGETIVLSRPVKAGEVDGVPEGTVIVLDGQHRLLRGAVTSGATFVTNIAWGIDPATQRSIDSGAVRTIRDVLSMDNEKHAAILGTVLRRQALWEQGARRFTGGHRLVTKPEMLGVFATDPQAFRRAAEQGFWLTSRPDGMTLCPAAAAAHAYYLLSRIDAADATWFFAAFRDGDGLELGSPVKALRQRFINDAANSGGNGRRKVATHQPLAYFIRAWNAHRSGNTLERIQHPADQPVPEPK